MLKRSLALAPAAVVLLYGLWIGPKYDRFVLPAFDGYVYDAMADNPRVFTLAPWGYRILEPWIVHLVPAPSAAVGFFWMNLVFLAACVFVVGSWLRSLGFGQGSAALASLTFALSPPIRELLHYQVLVDPLALLIVVLTLWELNSPRLLVLTALFAAGALTKEVCLLFLVLVPLVLIPRRGWKRGAIETLVIAAPALTLAFFLRATWGELTPVAGAPLLQLALRRLEQSGSLVVSTAALSGLGIAALVGLARETSVALRVQGALMWFLTLGAVLVNPYQFSIPDLPRLSAFAWPALLPLALSGLGFGRVSQPTRGPRFSRSVSTVAVVTLLLCASLVLTTDSFQRAPVGLSPNPITFLARIRESLKTARSLDAGETFTFDAASGRFATPVTERFNLTEGRQQRWFLYAGFGPDAAFGSGAPEFRGTAELLLPVLIPRATTIVLGLEGPSGAQVRVSVAGQDMGAAPADGLPARLIVPGTAFIRGDNIVRLRGPEGTAIRLRRFEVRLEPH